MKKKLNFYPKILGQTHGVMYLIVEAKLLFTYPTIPLTFSKNKKNKMKI